MQAPSARSFLIGENSGGSYSDPDVSSGATGAIIAYQKWTLSPLLTQATRDGDRPACISTTLVSKAAGRGQLALYFQTLRPGQQVTIVMAVIASHIRLLSAFKRVLPPPYFCVSIFFVDHLSTLEYEH